MRDVAALAGVSLKTVSRVVNDESGVSTDVRQRVERAVDGAVTTTWSSTNALVEMSGAGVTKASTLARLCAERGLDASEVVAFGDMPNDVDMLRWAGSSYAMENGHDQAREAAQHVAPRNDQDGVAQVLERRVEIADGDAPGGRMIDWFSARGVNVTDSVWVASESAVSPG